MDVITAVVQMVAVDEIKAAPFNPKSRTEKARLTKLMREIKGHGRIIYPLIIGSDGVLADGHRRLACAKLLGMPHVPVIYEDKPAAELYSVMNTGALPQRGIGWSQAVVQGLPVAEVRGPDKRLIELWQEALGPEDFAEMAMRRSPEIVKVARVLAAYVGARDDLSFLRSALLWVDKYDMQRAIIEGKRDGVAPQVFLDAIAADRPLRRGWF